MRNADATGAGPVTDEDLGGLAATIRMEFDERAYLEAYPDILISLETQEIASAREHFDNYGRREGRLTDEVYIHALGHVPHGRTAQATAAMDLDSLIVSAGGTVLVVGWIDDRISPLHSISIFAGKENAFNTVSFGRVRRGDVEGVLKAGRGHLFGFWAVAQLQAGLEPAQPWVVRARLADGRFRQLEIRPQALSDSDMRDRVLGYSANVEYFGNREVESAAALDAGIGDCLIALNRRITTPICQGAWVSYYGPQRAAFLGSIVVCLYGKAEFLFLQSALFSAAPMAREYEYIFVSNSPELTEALVKEARICGQMHELSIVLVCLPGNAGFGAANNAAASYARSNRLLITNPDVFPRRDDWARRHHEIVSTAPAEQTKLFGAPLYYDDGSLMHHGMYFETDAGVSVRPDAIVTRTLIRTEHYGKGAPEWSKEFVCPRPVPAITGAFMSADRDWYEKLGGFSEDYLFGHYEDADLSLKSLAAGTPVWMQDLPWWHMEGKGSVRRPQHEGGILVNRWLFTRRWGATILDGLTGPAPAHPLLAAPGPALQAAE